MNARPMNLAQSVADELLKAILAVRELPGPPARQPRNSFGENVGEKDVSTCLRLHHAEVQWSTHLDV